MRPTHLDAPGGQPLLRRELREEHRRVQHQQDVSHPPLGRAKVPWPVLAVRA